ncbi:MAG: L-threonylcarbamoyladenylate synthase [Omnitrophica bacterium]|nr:L-threonylcarbamoyladenylate synthase [Candidatus Omnitrophota bacterium]
MKTEVIKIDPEYIDLGKIKKAAQIIKQGGVVAFPTETVYGLAADFSNQRAVKKIFKLKKRPKNKPLAVQISDVSYLEQLACDVPARAYQLMSKFWPGPLTLVFKTNKGPTVGVRISANRIARSLVKESQTALVAPSANLSAKAPAKTAKEVLATFDGRIEMLIDGGKSELGIASTVVDLSVSPYKILREGIICRKDIEDALQS